MTTRQDIIRVLIVEVSPSRREALRENLRQAGYDVHVAEGEGEALIEDAHAKFMAHFCHVVVLAPRLKLADAADFSGLEASSRFAPAGIVIYTSEPNDEIAFRAGWEHMGYVRSSDPLRKLLAALEEQARRRPFTIRWPQSDFQEHVAAALKVEPTQITSEDLRILLGQVFPKAIGVELRPLPVLDTTMLAATPIRRAMVLWAQENRLTTAYLTPKVAKIGTRERIEREVENYTNCVEGRLRQDRQARLEGYAVLWHIGAVAYTFLGASPDELQSFRHYYTRNDPASILNVLRVLFTHTCQNWYGDQSSVETKTLYDYYNEALDLDDHIGRFDQTQYRLGFPGLPDELPNPALWVLREGREMAFPELRRCISHGDLHSDNFFVDHGNMVWLIDFEQTGLTHIFRDFVELEADIKLRLVQYPPEGDLAALAALERALLSGQTLAGMLLPTQEVSLDPNLYKAFQVISGIRHLAAIATGVNHLQEYTLALLYETLFMATQHRLRDVIKERARLSAALIVERMTRRTGLLSRGATIPRLDTARLQQPGVQTRQMLNDQLSYLAACYRSVDLQAQLHPDEPPPELAEGMSLLQQEGQRLRAYLDRVNV